MICALTKKAIFRSLLPKIKFSTVMPIELQDIELAEMFGGHWVDIYYSLYSVNDRFRRRWLPKALPAMLALEKLRRYQEISRKIPVLHWAFIEGENDDEGSVRAICSAVRDVGLRVDFNIVRYNPYSAKQGREPEEFIIDRNAIMIRKLLPGSNIKVVPRVGFDVKASCGMFLEHTSRSSQRYNGVTLPPTYPHS